MAYIQTAKAKTYNEFEELRPLIKEKLLDLICDRVYRAIPTSDKKEMVEEAIKDYLPDDKKHLLAELSDLNLENEVNRIKEAVFYVFANENEIKLTILGF